MKDNRVKMAGLAARDTLRIEAGLCLYGNELNENINPIEAGLTWCIPKRRKDTNEKNPFNGASSILSQISTVPQRKRVGIIMDGKFGEVPPAREGCVICDGENDAAKVVGRVTSGCPSPTVGSNICMGYIDAPYPTSIGTKVLLNVRSKKYSGKIVKMPFVPSNYYIKK